MWLLPPSLALVVVTASAELFSLERMGGVSPTLMLADSDCSDSQSKISLKQWKWW